MTKFGSIVLFCSFIVFFTDCVVVDNEYTALPPGIWRAALKVEKELVIPTATSNKKKYLPEIPKRVSEDVVSGELPFNFEVIYNEDGTFYIEIINGEERIPVKDVSFGRTKARAKDSIRIDFPIYESYIIAFYEDNALEGDFYAPNRGRNYSIPFAAKFGKDYRFATVKKEPVADLSGRWEVKFTEDDGSSYPAIGDFKQNGNHITGTFLTETGDYRFLEGTVQNDRLYMSCFDGAHAFLFEAEIKEDESIIGIFRSGSHYKSVWEAKKNADATLSDPNTLTYLVDGAETISFEFPNSDGKMISLDNSEYQNKIKIVQIFGTWCPNCKDETRFLVNYLKENDNSDLAVIGLAFEKHRDQENAFKAIDNYKDFFKMNYEIAYAGYYNKKEAAKSLPMLNHILSYPTMIFLDRENKVRKIHTGFAGPATSEFEPFEKEFDTFVKQLLSE
ncbi:TlpA family protein disulfide reductase [Saprospiraceae bacterium]|jgi:thiol-disulfide isomerase/thioredoxin|nr:TlpA family protein disulfide reductase [Saprospiraceae bacterium]